MSAYFECKLHESRVHEKIKTVCNGFIEKELKHFSYNEINNFIEENDNIIERVIADVVAVAEHQIDEVFFSPVTRYCIWRPKSPDNFAVLRESFYRHFNFKELYVKIVEKLVPSKNNIKSNLKRASDRIMWFIHEDLEKIIVNRVNPLTGKNYSLKDALIFIEKYKDNIEIFIIDFLSQQIKEGGVLAFSRLFNEENFHLQIVKRCAMESFYRELPSPEAKAVDCPVNLHAARDHLIEKKNSKRVRVIDVLLRKA